MEQEIVKCLVESNLLLECYRVSLEKDIFRGESIDSETHKTTLKEVQEAIQKNKDSISSINQWKVVIDGTR